MPKKKYHPARQLHKPCPVVYTAHSAYTSFMKHHICKFVLLQNYVPINPFMNFEYFLLDSVPRDIIRRGNNSYVHVSDEVWTFGIIADGVLEEVRLAKKLGKPVRHFTLGKKIETIKEISVNELEYEKDVTRIDDLENEKS
jgi:hypothetical protein